MCALDAWAVECRVKKIIIPKYSSSSFKACILWSSSSASSEWGCYVAILFRVVNFFNRWIAPPGNITWGWWSRFPPIHDINNSFFRILQPLGNRISWPINHCQYPCLALGQKSSSRFCQWWSMEVYAHTWAFSTFTPAVLVQDKTTTTTPPETT